MDRPSPRVSSHDAAALQALLHAGRELGPDMDDSLIASYAAQHHSTTQAHALPIETAARALARPRFMPALVLTANLGVGAMIQHIHEIGQPWGVAVDGTQLAVAFSSLAVLNITVATTLLLVLAGLGCAGMEVWRTTARLRGLMVTAMISATGVALYDWHAASAWPGPPGDVISAMALATVAAILLALLSLARPILHALTRALAADAVRAERLRAARRGRGRIAE